MKKVELLSPAGSLESFYGAINAGADAIYLAGEKYGARAFAQNFTTEELVQCIILAHIYNIKVYLTVNTLLKDSEIEELVEYIEPFYNASLDGVIVQDFGVAKIIKENFPNLELHASTQMTITGPEGAEFLHKNGFERIVPSRELSIQELQTIRQNSKIEMECFIHGAMCYSYSGQCLFSSVLGGRSGNRGRCAQPCRLAYQIVDEQNKHSETCYPISMKDQQTLEIIDKLIDTGIDSFKIEGRMKKPEYSAGVTAIYRKYIDLYYQTGKLNVSYKDLDALNKLYLRSEKQDGYYLKRNGKEMITLDSPAYNGADEALLEKIRTQYVHYPQNIGISVTAVFELNQPAYVLLSYKDIYVTVYGDIVNQAQKQPITKKIIEEHLNRLGDTPFYADNMEIILEDNCFYPLKKINDLRRSAIKELTDCILSENGYSKSHITDMVTVSENKEISEKTIYANSGDDIKEIKENNAIYTDNSYSVLLSTIDQLKAFIDCGFKNCKRVYLEGSLIKEAENQICDFFQNTEIPCYIALPYIFRTFQNRNLEELFHIYEKLQDKILLSGFLVRNIEEYHWLLKNGCSFDNIMLDAGIYHFNKQDAAWWYKKASGFCMPYELSRQEQLELLKHIPEDYDCEKIIYGRIPMMISANCIAKTNGTCHHDKEHIYALKDRKNLLLPVLTCCDSCYNIIYNTVPLCIWSDLKRYKYSYKRIQFSTENYSQTKKVLMFYESDLNNKPDFEFTTGFEKRSIE